MIIVQSDKLFGCLPSAKADALRVEDGPGFVAVCWLHTLDFID